MLTLKFRAQRYKKLVTYKTLCIIFIQADSTEVHFCPKKVDFEFINR